MEALLKAGGGAKKGKKANRSAASRGAAAEPRRMMPSVRASTDVGKDELPPFWEDPDFEGKSLPGKLYSAYVGQKGLLWWLNETAWYGSFALAFIWVCIRFVGPALGLWQLAD
eukprot:PRCOL_00005620-RA